jgi:hypothetical protein
MLLIDKHLKSLALPDDAITFLSNLYDTIQIFDDLADGDSVDRSALNFCIWNSLVGMGQNAFYQQHQSFLYPHIATAILKWQASDSAERAGQANEVSFVWRAGYYDVVLACVLLHHGPAITTEIAQVVMDMYGEKFEDYREEFQNA